MALKIIFKFLTPFIVALVDIISGVLLYLKIYCDAEISNKIFTLFSHLTGSSILLMLYALFNTDKMCIYYKSACLMIILFHTFSIIYLYININCKWYIYICWMMSILSLVLWTISILGYKSYNTIHQSCIRSKTE